MACGWQNIEQEKHPGRMNISHHGQATSACAGQCIVELLFLTPKATI